MSQITYFGKTDKGLVRSNNEDIFLIKSELYFCLVADGMGGAAAGEVASAIFAESALKVFSNLKKQSSKELNLLVQETFQTANTEILRHIRQNPNHSGMGCTAELLAFYDRGFVAGHMGDSRIYRLRKGILKQLTKDHSFVQEQLDQGLITAAEARTHPRRNMILRAVGIDKHPALDILRGEILRGDLFLLCSDGLSDMVEDTLIENSLAGSETLEKKVIGLIDSAKTAGGRDNITVVLAGVA